MSTSAGSRPASRSASGWGGGRARASPPPGVPLGGRAAAATRGRRAAGKPLGQWLERWQAEVVHTTWDPFGRVDVVRNPEDPLERFVFVDGAAGSALPRYPSDPNQETRRLTELGAFPYRLLDAERVLV